MLEQSQGVFAVLGLDGLAGELDLRALEQQQGTAEVGDGVAQLGVLDAVEGLFELRGLLFERGLFFFIIRRATARQQQRRT